MDDGWIEAGFFLMSPRDSSPPASRLLPPRIVTVSTCIAESHPDYWALPGVEAPSGELHAVRARLGLDEHRFTELRSWVSRALDDGEFGWPNVFFSLPAAWEFKNRFLGAVDGVRLLGLSLVKGAAEEFVSEEAPERGSSGLGVWTVLSRRRPSSRAGTQLGFDVLGAEHASFHTFSCNGLERNFAEELGIRFTEHGLIEDAASAIAACELVNSGHAPAEPVAWYPFRVVEHRGDAYG